MNQISRTKTSAALQINLLIAFFVVGMIISIGAIAALRFFVAGGSNADLWLSTTIQDLFMFMMPAIVVSAIAYAQPFKGLHLQSPPTCKALCVVLVMYFVSLPAMNRIVELNNALHLPESMQSIEQWMRISEQSAQQITDKLLSNATWAGLAANILVVSLLTALSEETIFRGALQNAVGKLCKNHHIVIWIVAIIFSSAHMQFFGFVPRMLLGAWLGYLVFWTKSLWVPVFAHALNNGMVVLSRFMLQRNPSSIDLDKVGTSLNSNQIATTFDASLILAICSAIATVVLFIWAARHLSITKDCNKA